MQQPSPAPLHGVTSASGTSYAYDTAGDRTNAGSATGLTWDAERRLVGWTSGSGATTATAAYDGEGNRVALQTITTSAPPPTPGRVKPKPLGPVGYSSTTSTTYYLLGLEDVTGGVVTKYIGAGGTLPSAVRVGSTLSYLASDGIGSVTESLDTAGNVTAQQLYAPYGRVRYQVGTLPTTKGYAGQRQDASSGLNDDAARYYDSSTAQFASADTASDAGNGLDRLAYVGGNPETLTDPTGHSQYCGTDCQNGGETGGGTGSGGNPPVDNGPTCNQGGCTSGGGQTSGNSTGSKVKWPKGCGGCKAATNPTKTAQTSPKCDHVCHAQGEASTAALQFGLIGGGLGLIAALIGVLAALLTTAAAADIASIIGIPEGVALGEVVAQLTVLAGMITALGVEAGILAGLFGYQASRPDGWGRNSLEKFRNTVTAITIGFIAVFSGIMQFTFSLASELPGGQAAVIGLEIGAVVDDLGSVAFGVIANGAVNDEETVMGE